MPDRIPFRLRAHEVSRLEAFADIVFGFALTLIVVSLEVPKDYDDLMHAMSDFPSFALCFATLLWIWHGHYTYMRRYGLNDTFTLVLTGLLLFMVLFYVYPLKFMFAGMLHGTGVTVPQARMLFTVYSGGFAGIFLLYGFLYFHAYALRDTLDLNAVEVHDTITHVLMFAGNAFIGVLSLIMAWTLPDRWLGFAGWIYFMIGVVSGTVGSMRGGQRRGVEDTMLRGTTDATAAT